MSPLPTSGLAGGKLRGINTSNSFISHPLNSCQRLSLVKLNWKPENKGTWVIEFPQAALPCEAHVELEQVGRSIWESKGRLSRMHARNKATLAERHSWKAVSEQSLEYYRKGVLSLITEGQIQRQVLPQVWQAQSCLVQQ